MTVDNISPTVKVSYPYTKEVFYFKPDNPEKMRIQADARDESAMERVEFFMDDQPIGISTVAPYNIFWPIVLTRTQQGKLVHRHAHRSTPSPSTPPATSRRASR